MRIRVECYAGYKANQRPIRFYLGERKYEVEEVSDQWYGPENVYFRVRAEDGNIYILGHAHTADEDFWTLESFRQVRAAG